MVVTDVLIINSAIFIYASTDTNSVVCSLYARLSCQAQAYEVLCRHSRAPGGHARLAIPGAEMICNLRYRLEVQGQRMSPNRMRRALNALQISIPYDTKGSSKFGLPAPRQPMPGRSTTRWGCTGIWRRSPTRHRGSRDRPKRSHLSRVPAHLMGDSVQNL